MMVLRTTPQTHSYSAIGAATPRCDATRRPRSRHPQDMKKATRELARLPDGYFVRCRGLSASWEESASWGGGWSVAYWSAEGQFEAKRARMRHEGADVWTALDALWVLFLFGLSGWC